MPDANDMDLVREYATANSEPAFETLVRRHVSLVYSVALRQVGNPAQAEEITQAVFLILARKAARLRPDTVLAGWLHETARFASASFLRGESRRHRREQEAYVQSKLQESTADPAWEQLAPLLDEAIGQLGKADRNAVVLRFFQNKSAREIADALNVRESAAQKRLNRAVEKLRAWFLKRGVAVSADALSGALSVNSIPSAPAHLAASVMAVSAKGTAVSSSTLTLIKGALKIMAWTKAKTIVAVSVAVIMATGTTTTLVVQHRHHIVPRSSWAFAGYANPESAFQTSSWAISKGDAQAWLASLTPAMQLKARQRAAGDDAKLIGEDDKRDFAKITGYRIIHRQVLSKDEVVLEAYAAGLNQTTKATFQRIGGEWKYAGKPAN